MAGGSSYPTTARRRESVPLRVLRAAGPATLLEQGAIVGENQHLPTASPFSAHVLEAVVAQELFPFASSPEEILAALQEAEQCARAKLDGFSHRAAELHAIGDGWGLLAIFANEQQQIKSANDEYHFAHRLAERGICPPVDTAEWIALAELLGQSAERDPRKIAILAGAMRYELDARGLLHTVSQTAGLDSPVLNIGKDGNLL